MRSLRLLAVLLLFAATADGMDRPSYHTKGTPTGKATGSLKPGEYWWHPELSPLGPVLILVSIPQQTLQVYRNGILIGRSAVSTGSKGHETPPGVFTILEKKATHRSKKYDNAPMPYMQRLTWSGIAMHSGNLPGYAASHGCIRMPYDFSQLLFQATAMGGTVVVGDGKSRQPHLAANPGVLLAPADLDASMLKPLAPMDYQWAPERSAKGPITIVISAADRAMYVYRNGNVIGRAAVEIRGYGPLGGHVVTLLEGTTNKPSLWTPGRAGRRWLQVSTDQVGRGIDPESVAKRLRFNPEFATKLYDAVGAGTTIVVTDAPAVRNATSAQGILAN